MKKLILFFSILSKFIFPSYAQVTDFKYELIGECNLIMAEFSFDNSFDQVDSCCWDFGDGVVVCRSHSNTASHIYNNPGTYTVELTVWKNGTDTRIIKKDLVEVYLPPITDFKIVKKYSSDYSPLFVEIKNKTVKVDCSVVQYYWEFSNGFTSSVENPTFLFETPGTYYVNLTVTDTLGCSSFIDDHIVVKDTAQRNEFEYIVSNCSEDSCNWNKPHILEVNDFLLNQLVERNDTLFLTGIILQNCCTKKTATLNNSKDTIFIKTWEVGAECYCSDYFYFEIPLPKINNDSIYLSFNNEIIRTTLTNAVLTINESNFYTYPNPVHENLKLGIPNHDYRGYEYVILDTQGKVIQAGELNSLFQIKLNFADTGLFFIKVRNMKIKKFYTSRFIKI